VAIQHHRAFESATEHKGDAALTALARTVAEIFLDPEGDEERAFTHPAVVELNLYDDEVRRILGKRDDIHSAARAVNS
jgi:hypothetical protein